MAIQPDGPIKKGECSDCLNRFKSDIYRYKGKILCGDCRYAARHGHEPEHTGRDSTLGNTSGNAAVVANIQYHGEYGPKD